MKTKLLALTTALASLTASASLVPIFQPDFAGSFQGTADNQFNYVGVAVSTYATTSTVGSAFQMVTTHVDGDLINTSATRLSRHGSSTPANALAFQNNVGVIQTNFAWNNTQWTSGDQSVFNIVIGEDFRSGAFNPARGGAQVDGPSFANLSLQARSTENQFRFIAGGGTGSANFDLVKDGNGFYNADIFAAFNNSGTAQTLTTPTGAYELNHASLAIWVDNVLVWDNYANATNIRDAQFQHVSFGMGVGSNSDFATAEAFGGTYQLSDIVVSTIPEPGTLGLIGLAGLLLLRRFRKQRLAAS